MTPCEEFAYKFTGLAEFAAEVRRSPISDRTILNRLIELGREFRQAEQPSQSSDMPRPSYYDHASGTFKLQEPMDYDPITGEML